MNGIHIGLTLFTLSIKEISRKWHNNYIVKIIYQIWCKAHPTCNLMMLFNRQEFFNARKRIDKSFKIKLIRGFCLDSHKILTIISRTMTIASN